MTMPRQKDLKRLVRARMQKTGESYTAARTQLLRKSPPRARVKQPAVASPAPAKIDYAKVAGMSDEVIKEKTGRTWEEWTRTLDTHDAASMAHRDIAQLVHTTYKVQEWWTQMLTVGYERIKGLRARGQRRDGTYEAGKSRTFNVPVAELFDAWNDAAVRRRWLSEPGVKVRTATASKAMRLGWPDGTIVVVAFAPKGAGKSNVALTHTKVSDKATSDRLKQYWAEKLDALAVVLGKK
jgi:hypothetical protein